METKLRRQSGIKVGILPDGHVMLHLEDSEWVYLVTPVGGLVWEFCDGTNSLDEVVERILEVEGISATAELKDQVFELIAEFQKLGLLVPVESVIA